MGKSVTFQFQISEKKDIDRSLKYEPLMVVDQIQNYNDLIFFKHIIRTNRGGC